MVNTAHTKFGMNDLEMCKVYTDLGGYVLDLDILCHNQLAIARGLSPRSGGHTRTNYGITT